VDECVENRTICGDRQCANIPGSFQCLGKCDVGFKRTMDDKACVGRYCSCLKVRSVKHQRSEHSLPCEDEGALATTTATAARTSKKQDSDLVFFVPLRCIPFALKFVRLWCERSLVQNVKTSPTYFSNFLASYT